MQPAWTVETVAGRPVEICQTAPRPTAALFWLHDLDGRSFQGRPALEAAVDRCGGLAVCPAGGASWWLDQPVPDFNPPGTPLQFLASDLLSWLAARWELAPPRIAVVGLGMGGQGAVNLAFRRPRLFPIVAGILPDIDFHQWHGLGSPLDRLFPTREAARQQTATLHLHPLNWPRRLLLCCDPRDARFEGVERLASKLTSSGIPFEFDGMSLDRTSVGCPDAWSYCERMIPRVAKFLADGLAAAKALT